MTPKDQGLEFNITTMIGIASFDFTTYIVTEFAVNGSLFDYLHVEKKKTSADQRPGLHKLLAERSTSMIMTLCTMSLNMLLSCEWVARSVTFAVLLS